MGVDIHINLVNNKGEIIEKNLYPGRNSEWFGNLSGRGCDFEYEHLPKSYGKEVPEEIKVDEDKLSDDGYYGFTYIKVPDFIEWFLKYKPHLHAGWATTYDKWRIENKGYIPDELPWYLEKDDCVEDYHFIEYTDNYDCSLYIYEKIISILNDFDNIWIVYYFDC